MSAENMSEDDREQIMFVATQAKQNILIWKAYLIHSINQDEARLDVLQDLDQASILLVQDWAIKFLPRISARVKRTGLQKETFPGI